MSTRLSVPPILILAFNRPDTLRRLIHTLRPLAPPVLYCSQDGPRAHNPIDTKKCKEVKEVWGEIDWKCELHFLIRKKNLGCQKAVSQAITWFFETEEMGIILEDDCIPDASFFPFCGELLKKYKDDDRIMHIAGNSFIESEVSSYHFTRYPFCWGWATWRRAWKHFDVEMVDWPSLRQSGWLQSLFPNPISPFFWKRMYDGVYQEKIDSWAIPWVYSVWTQNGLCIQPNINLVTNIGFGKNSTHTPDAHSPLANIRTAAISLPLNHPEKMVRENRTDDWNQLFVYEQRTLRQLLTKLRSVV